MRNLQNVHLVSHTVHVTSNAPPTVSVPGENFSPDTQG